MKITMFLFLFLKQSLILSQGMLTLYRYEGQILTESIVVFCLVLCLPALDTWNLVIGRLTVVWDNFGKYVTPYTVLTSCYITAILCIFCLLPAAINQKRPNPQEGSRQTGGTGTTPAQTSCWQPDQLPTSNRTGMNICVLCDWPTQNIVYLFGLFVLK